MNVLNEEVETSRRSRSAMIGFGVGIGVGFSVTAFEVASDGFHFLLIEIVCNLIWAPLLGLSVGLGWSWYRRAGRGPSWRRQLRIQTLMGLVAYVALLFGLGLSTQRLTNSSHRSLEKAVSSQEMASIFLGIGRRSLIEAQQTRVKLKQLRSGTIPSGLLPGQAEFLTALDADPKATAEYRKYRRVLIIEREEEMRALHERNVVVFGDLVEYYQRLAAKYEQARWHPWLPVEPDPPVPPTQEK